MKWYDGDTVSLGMGQGLGHFTMEGVARDRAGTAFAVFKTGPYPMSVKTGTSQVYLVTRGNRYDAKTLAELKRDNSVFVAFSPLDNPEIIIATIVEDGGWCSGPAAQITRAVLDYEMRLHARLADMPTADIAKRYDLLKLRPEHDLSVP